MKKIFSMILIVFVLISSCIIPVSAEEAKYIAIFNAPGVFVCRENKENLIQTAITLSDAEDFVRGEIIFRYAPLVFCGAPENMKFVPSEKPERFNINCEKYGDYVKLTFEKNDAAEVVSDKLSIDFLFKTLSVGEHDLSIEVTAYNEKNEKTEYDVVYAFDLYEKTVLESEIPVIDKSIFELRNDYIYIDHKTTPDSLIEKIEGTEVAVCVPVSGKLDDKEYIPNGAYLVTFYKGYVAKRYSICVSEDVNCDAKITAADARLALRCSAKLEELSVISFYAADVNADEKVTAADARLILRKAAGLE